MRLSVFWINISFYLPSTAAVCRYSMFLDMLCSADPLRKRLWKRIYIFGGLVCRVLEQCSADPLRIPSAYPVFSFFWPGVPKSTSGAPQTPLRRPPPLE